MSTVATIWVKLGLNADGYKKGLAGAESRTSSAAANMGSKLKGIGSSMLKTGAIATAGLTVPIVAGLGKSVMAASDLEESINAVNVVFGDAASTILDFGTTSATAVGLSASEFQSMATITGALLQNLGFDADAAAEGTLNLANRAADMASVFNTDVDQALSAVNSALKGEFNPLEQFGVKLMAADINARAMAMGLADAEGQLDNNARAQAALAIIMEQTDKIAGDFQNTSEGLANSQRILKAQLGDAAAEIGTILLPAVTSAVQWFSKMITVFRDLSPGTQKIIVGVLLLVAVIGPLLLVLGALATAVGALMPVFVVIGGFLAGPFLVPILAIIAIIALLAAAWKNNWGGIRDKTKAAVKFIIGILNAFWNRVKGLFKAGMAIIRTIFERWSSAFSGGWTAFGEKMRKAWGMIWELIKKILSMAGSTILKIVGTLIKSVVNFFTKTDWKGVGINIVKGIGAGLKSMMGWIGNAARDVASAALSAAKGFLGIGSPSKAFGELGKFAAMGFGVGFSKAMSKVQPSLNVSMAGNAQVAVPSGGQDTFDNQSGFDAKELARAIRDVLLREKL